MKTASRQSHVGAPQARFFWQGVLILIPAVLLAGFGIFSLRQDRLLVEIEATDEATKLARNLVERHLPDALLTVPSVANSRFALPPENPAEDPIYQSGLRSPPEVLCLINEEFELIHPPPVASWPQPRLLDEHLLNPDQQSDWREARRAYIHGADFASGLNAYTQFLASDPPAEFAAMALYESALLSQKSGDLNRAIASLELLVRNFPEAVGETGLLIRDHAEWQLLNLDGGRREQPVAELAKNFCARAVLLPTPLTPQYLDDAVAHPNVARLASEWKSVWKSHERARELHQEWRQQQNGVESRWIDYNGAPYFTGVVREPQRIWLLARSEIAVRQMFRDALAQQSIPGYFTMTLRLSGRGIGSDFPLGHDFRVMAEAAGLEGSVLNSAVVQVFLSNPASFYGRQRARTLWFGSLIAVSVLAVCVGFYTAWRSFRAQQNLSAMKTNFVSSVSHEMRAPLASIRLMAEELSANEENPNRATYHRLMVQECRRVSGLIENVLDFSRHEQGRKQYEFEPVDLCALVRETVRLMEPYAAERGVPLCLDVEQSSGLPVEPELDSRSMQQLLVNLIDNAIKHSPEGDVVRVALKFPTDAANEIKNQTPPRFQISVEDQGAGIPEDELDRIFERFYRRGSELRRETPGIGLGLAIVKYVAEAHRGTVSVQSAAGQGSRFWVEIPMRQIERE